MLQNLHVKNLALIDESEVDFAGGLNILSGETGAGKSIIIGSINLALGGKVQKEMLRDPEKPALVELIFSVTEKQKQVLKQLDVETEDDEVILSRRITGGRGVSKVNGESVPASKVKEIASVLIDIHGQHEHQSLLSKKKHLEILDSYAKEEIEQPKKELAEAYKDYKKLVSELNDADVDEEERLREVSFLEYEVGEIEEAGLTVGEDEELETQYKRFINGKKIVEALNQAYQYTGGMDQASELTGRALRELSGVSVYDEKIADMEETLTQIDNLLGDFNREIADYLDDTDFDEETFYHLEKRLDEINHLKSKYGSSIEEILSACEAKQERLLRLKDYDTYLADLKEKVKNAEKKLQKSCEKVSDIRKKYAEKLVIAVTEALKDLNDSGISGRTAQMVSEKMNLLGRTHQIICITHLPQIAAMADAHYLIEKAVSNGATVSKIRWLDTAETVDELSRMLGGVEITDKVRESAREMKELAAKKKK